MKEPLISLVIPARNEAENIERLLRSLGGNDFEDFEVVVVDGGSTDRTEKIADEWGARVMEGPQEGPSVARDIGWREAKGEYIYFLDADFYLEEGALDTIAETIQNNSEAESIGTDVTYDTRGAWVSECVMIENRSSNGLNRMWRWLCGVVEKVSS